MSEAVLNLEMQQSVLRTLQTTRDLRPRNTSRSYASKQDEFRSWCDFKEFDLATRYEILN